MTPYTQFQQDFASKKILIMGLGLQGRGVTDAAFFAKIGAQVTVTDTKTASQLTPSLQKLKSFNINYSLGGHQPSDITNADVIIRNPSVPWKHPLLDLARQHHIPIHMDESLFFLYAKPQAVGITGTRGKTTTTKLIFHLLQSTQPKLILAGNLVPHASLSLLPDHHQDNLYIYELSSWQLQAFHHYHLSPQVSVITNIYPDHLLDRSMDEYVNDKTAIFAYQQPSDTALFNQNDPYTSKFLSISPGQTDTFSPEQIPPHWKLLLPGHHNQENIAAAIKVARHFHVPDSSIQTVIESFKPIAYRLQKVATINQVTFINDTTSTTPVALTKALETYPHSILIMGGSTKHLPTQDMVDAVNQQAKAVFLLKGTGTTEVVDQINPHLIKGTFSDLSSALTQAFSFAKPGDTLLFSPGFTSFGLFDNEFDRGRQFNQIVHQLQLKHQSS